MNTYDLIVIGGGAAGMLAAGTAASRGKGVVLIEKNPALGKKLLITGKGRCNLTNYCEVKELIRNTPVNGKFMTNAFYRFTAYDAIDFFENHGVKTKVERGNRVFPESDKAHDVFKALSDLLKNTGVQIINKPAIDVVKFGEVFAVKLANGDVIRGQKLIIATGGKSYPGTGSTGDGYKFARDFGHKITKFKPSLVPIVARDFIQSFENIQSPQSAKFQVPALQGLSLRNAAIRILDEKGKKIYEDFGEMLFTHFGVSGPIILSATSHIRDIKNHQLVIDLKPALDEKQLDLRILRDFAQHSRKKFENILKGLLPKKMIPVIISLSGIPGDKPVNQISKDERKRLRLLLKNFTIRLEKFRTIDEAIITSGGVNVSEIDPKTMESKIISGLYFAGEVLDVDAYTGGFNLQIAWSSGYAAGMSC